MKPAPILILAACLSFSPSVHGDETPPRKTSPLRGWETLRLEVRQAAFFSGFLEITRGEQGEKAYVQTRASARFFGARIARSRTLSVLEPKTGRTSKHLRFSKRRGKRFKFDKSGYSVEKLTSPAGFEAPDAEWLVASTRTFDYPATEDGDLPDPVLDYYGMLLHLRHAGLNSPGDECVLSIATSKGTIPYRIRVAERRTRERTLKHLETGKKTTFETTELRLRVIPDDPERSDKGFLNMEGESELWVDADTMALLEVRGRVPKAGRIELRLVGIE